MYGQDDLFQRNEIPRSVNWIMDIERALLTNCSERGIFCNFNLWTLALVMPLNKAAANIRAALIIKIFKSDDG